MPARRMEEFRQKCRQSGLACTHQRQVIYRTLAESDEHLNPELLYERVRTEIPSISLGTVYKTIRTLVGARLLREVSPLHESVRLDANLEPHHHFVCVRCKAVHDLEEQDVEPVRLRRSLPRGFRAERTTVEVTGLCAGCARGDRSIRANNQKEK